MRVDIETIDLIIALKKAINSTPLEEIEFYEKGEKIEVAESKLEDFRLTGLSNCCFIEMRFYENEYERGERDSTNNT